MAVKNLFRAKALANASPLDEMDERLELLSPRLWLGLAGVSLLLVVAGIWGWLGRIDTKVGGTGILMNLGGVRTVAAQSHGIIKYLNVEEGSIIEQYQIIGEVEQPMLRLEIKQLIEKFIILEDEFSQIVEAEKKNTTLHDVYIKNITGTTNETISKLTQIQQYLHELSDMYKGLREKGITSKVAFYEMLQNTINAEVNVTQQRTNKYKLPIEEFEFYFNKKRLLWDKIREIKITLNSLDMKKMEYFTEALLWSPVKGQVINVMKHTGDSVSQGEEVITIIPRLSDSIKLTAFIPLKNWKRVKINQLVYIAPTDLEPQRYGYMLGLVRDISHYPDTEQTLGAVLKNRSLVNDMKKGENTVIRVTVELIPDPGNQTGIKWTCNPPKDITITSGAPCNVFVVVERRPPITYVVPWLKEKLLGIGKDLPLDRREPQAALGQ